MLSGCLGQPGVSVGQPGCSTAQPHAAAAELPPHPPHHGPATSGAHNEGQGQRGASEALLPWGGRNGLTMGHGHIHGNAELQPVSPPCRAPPRGTPRGCSPPGGVRSWLRAGAMKKAVLSRTQDERRHSPPSGLRTSKKSSPQISFWSPRSCKDKDKDKDTHVRGCLEMASGTGRPVSRAETRGKPPHRHPWGLHCLHPAPSKCPGKAPGLGAPEHPCQRDCSPGIPPAPWGARGTVTEQGAQGGPLTI